MYICIYMYIYMYIYVNKNMSVAILAQGFILSFLVLLALGRHSLPLQKQNQ